MFDRSPDARYAEWIEFAGALLQRPDAPFPAEAIGVKLIATLSARSGSLSRADALVRSATVWPSSFRTAVTAEMKQDVQAHPLVRWFSASGSAAPQSVARIPRQLVDPRAAARWEERLKALNLEHQLSIPLCNSPSRHVAFVLSRGERDFTEADLELAGHLQPLIRGLEINAQALARWRAAAGVDPASDELANAGLTGREVAVLHALANGLTATAIGRRLGISTRTVHKHLEHIYAKLHAKDRLSAVLTAQSLGILPR